LESALTADKFGSRDGKQVGGQDAFGSIAYELISQSFALYEEHTGESKLQSRCIVAMIGTLLACRALGKEDYESLIMKTAQYAAKMLKKSDQCEMVALCSYLFYVVGEGVSMVRKGMELLSQGLLTHCFYSKYIQDVVIYSNPQRGLECLQRALKLADAC
jgi:vacuolar protein sorting-associated protein 35